MGYEFADRLIEMRRAKGLSQEELARELGLSRQAVSKWERAESAPDIGNLVALSSIYEVSLDELVRGTAEAEDEAGALQAQASQEPAPGCEDATLAEKAGSEGCEMTPSSEEAAPRTANGIETVQSKGAEAPARPPQASPDGIPSALASAHASACGGSQASATKGAATTTAPDAGTPVPPEPAGSPIVPPVPTNDLVVATPSELAQRPRRSALATFPYPVFVALTYLVIGFCFGLWNPGWVIFFTIPFYYWVVKIVENDPEHIARHGGPIK